MNCALRKVVASPFATLWRNSIPNSTTVNNASLKAFDVAALKLLRGLGVYLQNTNNDQQHSCNYWSWPNRIDYRLLPQKSRLEGTHTRTQQPRRRFDPHPPRRRFCF